MSSVCFVLSRIAPDLLLPLMIGCASYEYDITRPADQRMHVSRKSDAVVRLDPLEYHLRATEGRLVMQIKNPTQEAIQLDGDRSAVVDTEGQSHPLRSQTIASGSFIKLIIPPMRPRVQPNGPVFGIGVGVSASRYDGHERRPLPPRDPFLDQPQYLTVYDDSDAYYFDFKAAGNVRLVLVYHRGEETFTHEIGLNRSKK
jgi:hypothetical protein